MANNTLKTRVVLNNKTSSEWASSTYSAIVPLKGEVCIYSDLRKIKIGDGTNTITDLQFANLTPEEVTQLIQASSHSHSNKSVLDNTTASFTTALLEKLNGIQAGAEVNQNTFSKISVGSTTVEADSKTDTLTLVGSNVTITPDATNDKLTFTVANGSTSAKGVVQLTDSTSSTSTTTAATPNSVKSAYDRASTAITNAATAQSTADSKVGSVSLATGSSNGQVALTVDGTTTNVSVKGLGTAAYTASSAYATSAQGTKADNAMPKAGGTFTGAVTLNADPSTALGAATKQYVDSQITSKIAASDAMVFKGTLGSNGTVTAVPTSGVVKGDTYKIITAGTYAGSACKIGDLLIALNSGSIEANTTNWVYVPSGNENETSIKYSKTTQNLTTSAQTGAITLGEGATKQVDTSITSDSASTNLPTTAAVASFVNGQVSSVNSSLSSHTGDTTVHITASERTKWNSAEVNQNAFSNIVVGDTTIAADSKTDSLTLVAGTNVTLTPDATNDKVTITAKDTTYGAAGTSLGLVKSGGDVTIASGVITVNDDSHNHVIDNIDGLQSALDGKAATSHGTHVTYSTTVPAANGTASVGSASTVSRSDHVHPLQTSVSGSSGSCTGNSATATKLANARTIALSGGCTGTATSFNGTANISIPVTAVDAAKLTIASSDTLILDGCV